LDQFLINKFENQSIHDYINGTSVPNLDSSGLLSGCPIIIPITAVINAFSSFCKIIYVKLYSKENITLVALRDFLLPKLISGEIRIKDAEKLLERTQ